MEFKTFSDEIEEATLISQNNRAIEARAFCGVTILICSKMQAIAWVPVFNA